MRVLAWVLRVALAALFFGTGGMKLAGGPEALRTFESLGLGAGGLYFIGAVEILGALGLLLSATAELAALGLAVVMVGAVASHLLVLGPSAVPALGALAGCLAVAWLERGGLGALRTVVTGKGPMGGWLARSYDRGIQTAFRDLFPTLAGDVITEIQGAHRVLDAGCGPGQFTILAAEMLPGTQLCGVDLAPAMIALARRHAAASPAVGRLHFDLADVTRLPFPDAHFDAVMTTGSIKQWPDPTAGLRELHRVLAPGGRAFVAELNRAAPPEAVAAVGSRVRGWFVRRLFPHAVAQGIAPHEGRALLARSPFGAPVAERFLLDGCVVLFEARKAAVVGIEREPAHPA